MMDKILAALEAHIKDGNVIQNHQTLAKILYQVCGFHDSIGERCEKFDFEGWTIERKIGSDFKGARGTNLTCVGWIATHIDSGRIELFAPSGGVNVSPKAVENWLQAKNDYHAASGKWPWQSKNG